MSYEPRQGYRQFYQISCDAITDSHKHTHSQMLRQHPANHSQKTQLHESITQPAWGSPGYSRLFVFTYLSMIKSFSLRSYSQNGLILALHIIHGSGSQCNVSESSLEQRLPPVTPDCCYELVNVLFVPSASCDLEN